VKSTWIEKFWLFRPILWMKQIVAFERQQQKLKQKPDVQSPEYIQYQRCIPWFAQNGDTTLRLNYPLQRDSVVFDVGGFEGEFASQIYNKYGSKIYVFEPLPSFYQLICNRFEKNDHIQVYDAGLSDVTKTEMISVTGDRSSLFIDANKVSIKLIRAVDFIQQHQIQQIDLMKVNIEGAEYDLLDDLIAAGMMDRIVNLQVQFHDFIVPNARQRMEAIQDKLSQTHERTYQFEFVWENWKKK
jgi:FkbM family methyltransferase